MKDNPQAQIEWQAKIAALTHRIATPLRFGDDIAEEANRRRDTCPPLGSDGKFKRTDEI